MASLGEAYGNSRWGDRDPHTVYAGIAVFVVGALAIVAAIGLVTTPLSAVFDLDEMATYRVAGIVAGLGVPATLSGVVAVLTASRRQQVGVVVGAVVAVVGVGLFAHAYPTHWTASGSPLAFYTAVVYVAGGLLALGSVFAALANAHVRNNPHGTVRLRLTRQGETRTVEVSREDYRRYAKAVSDGGEDTAIIREIESKYED
ncbi:MAG: DUF7139 domain-containing protein [Halorhabdus sp.]